MANFIRNWRRPSRVCLYVLSGGCDLQFIYTLLRVNFSVLFLCMSPFRTIKCIFSNVFTPFDFLIWHYQFWLARQFSCCLVVQSHQPAQLRGLHASPTWPPGCWSAPPPPPPPTPTSPFRCECISRSRLTQSVSHPATLFDACHTPQLVSTSCGQNILPYSHLIGLRPS